MTSGARVIIWVCALLILEQLNSFTQQSDESDTLMPLTPFQPPFCFYGPATCGTSPVISPLLLCQISLFDIDLCWVTLLFPIRPLLGLMTWKWIDGLPVLISSLKPAHHQLQVSSWCRLEQCPFCHSLRNRSVTKIRRST